MEHQQIEQNISIIKEMIEKTRKETAQSGNFFIFIGIMSIALTLLILFLEDQWELPIIAGMVVFSAIVGYLTVGREEKKQKVQTYAKTVFGSLWLACGLICISVIFLFPFLNAFPFQAVPVLTSLIVGIGLFTTGAVYQLPFVQWCSIAWWLGAILMSLAEAELVRILIMDATIAIGFVLPGIIFNRKYKHRSA